MESATLNDSLAHIAAKLIGLGIVCLAIDNAERALGRDEDGVALKDDKIVYRDGAMLH